MTAVLTAPGYTGSGPGHWPTLWEREDSALRRVQQRDWDAAGYKSWPEGRKLFDDFRARLATLPA